jgi:hypothetical protein
VFLGSRAQTYPRWFLTLYQMLPVVLAIQSRDPSRLSQRFVGNSTTGTTFDCSQANVFLQGDGRLVSFGRPLSAEPGARYVDINDFPTGTVTCSLDVVDGFLVWRNSTFYGGTAGFCQGTDGDVYATFTESGGPDGCTPVALAVYSGKSIRPILRVPLLIRHLKP